MISSHSNNNMPSDSRRKVDGYMWQLQPYKSWKDSRGSASAAVPSSSRPLVNGPRRGSHVASNGPAFRARPIKHWRNQLQPRRYSGGRRRMYNSWIPGSTVPISGGVPALKPSCCGSSSGVSVPRLVWGIGNGTEVAGPGGVSSKVQGGLWRGTKTLSPNGVRCNSCSPPNRVIRSGQVRRLSNYAPVVSGGPPVLTSRYYPNAGSYLYARYKTYDQNLGRPGSVPEGPAFARNRALYPGNSCFCPTVEPPFKNQVPARSGVPTGVSSSERILRLKVATVRKASCCAGLGPFGQAAGAAVRYQPSASDLISTKRFYQKCVPHHVHQNKNLKCPRRS